MKTQRHVTLSEFIEASQGELAGRNHALADTDFYFFTMAQVYDALLPQVTMSKKFHNRTPGINLAKYSAEVSTQVDLLCTRRLAPSTLARLHQVPYMTKPFLEFMRLLQLNREFVTIEPNGDLLDVRTCGPARFNTWFEVHVMSMVQEAYFRDVHGNLDMYEGMVRLEDKIKRFQELAKTYKFTFSEFGTRRRACHAWQHHVVGQFVKAFADIPGCFLGTSNVQMAVEFGTPFSGTMAHEFLQIGQALDTTPLGGSDKHMLDLWQQFYRAKTGIALTDVVGHKAFLRDFDMLLAQSYIGVRNDSGDPFEWAEESIRHYEKLHIDPKSKVLMFSNGLNTDMCERLLKEFSTRSKVSFGIGTDFTNDLGVKALQLVMKAVTVNGRPVAKISDEAGKGMCEDPRHEEAVRRAYMVGEHFSQETHDAQMQKTYGLVA